MIFFLRFILILILAPLAGGRAWAMDGGEVVILAPATPASIPIILAVDNMPGVRLKIFHSHPQAHAIFLRNEAQILSTGISVGVSFFRQKIPVKIINSHVSGLSFLVTTRPIRDFRDLVGEKIWLPFPGSPLEEVSRFFAQSEGLVWKKDILVGYSIFESSVKLLHRQKINAVVLPEPFVSLVENDPNLFVGLEYAELWEKYTKSPDTCPQVGTFVNAGWAEKNQAFIGEFNRRVGMAIELSRLDPGLAVERAEKVLHFPPGILKKSLGRTRFHLLTGLELKKSIFSYYNTIGSPLDERFNNFF